MAADIIVPPLSQTMDTVVLVEWLKDVGDEVVRGEPLFSIETEKAILEIESPASGILQQTLVEPGTEVEVESKIGAIASPDEAVQEDPELKPTPEVATAPPPTTMPAPASAAPSPTAKPAEQPLVPERPKRIPASPRARRLAQQEGVALEELEGTGPEQMIVEEDVHTYLQKRGTAASATTPTQGSQSVALSPIRQTIARRMLKSHQTTAPVTLTREVDATELVHRREQILEELTDEDLRPTYTDLLISIVAQCLRRHPDLNATTDDAGIITNEQVHIGVAVDTDRGLMVPVVRHADRKGLLELARERGDLVRRTIEGTVTPEELTGGTFTVTNLGTLGVDAFTPIINSPQAAILGIGRIRPSPAVHEGELCIRQLMYLSLTFDHRIVDGAPAASFLQDLAQFIENPHLT